MYSHANRYVRNVLLQLQYTDYRILSFRFTTKKTKIVEGAYALVFT